MNKWELIEDVEKIGIYNLNLFGNKVKSIPTKTAIKLIKQLDEPEKVKIPQFVEDWYEENKDCFEGNLYRFVCNLTSTFDGAKLNEFERWFLTAGTKPFQTLINMHQFGYEVEEEPKYTVRVKGVNEECEYLFFGELSNTWKFRSLGSFGELKKHHTRKELEDAGFGWVFDCPGVEVEEVKE